MNSPVLVSAAVPGEISFIKDAVISPVYSKIGGREILSGYIRDVPVQLLITGPGLVNTVQSLTAAIENKKPGLIIQTGCAGAFRESGLNTGDIAIASSETYIHLGIEPEKRELPLEKLPFPIMTCNEIDITNQYAMDEKRVYRTFNILNKAFAGKKFQIRTGPFITVSTITATDRRAKALYKHFRPCMENMEGSGAAHTALHYDIPFLEIRAASNFVGKRDRDAWNLPLAFERCGMAVVEVV